MTKTKIKISVVPFIIFQFYISLVYAQYNGYVIDEKGAALVGVTISVENQSVGTKTDNRGFFSITIPRKDKTTVIFQYLGYMEQRIEINFETSLDRLDTIILRQEPKILNIVEILESQDKPIRKISEDIISNFKGSFANSLDYIPGISTINVGVGISKPVIRGLSSNRIIVNQNGIRMEGQQWGSDHGLELDAFDVDRLEVIKGARTLLYGADVMGGIINILPPLAATEDGLAGEMSSIYKTNNNHLGGSLKLRYTKDRLGLSFRYTTHHFSDYKIPIESFEYNGFVLPIYDNNLNNTAGRESNFAFDFNYISGKSLFRMRWSRYQLNSGLFSGAVGIPRSYTLQSDGDRRNVDIPSQKVNHNMFTLNYSYAFKKWHWITDLGLQLNNRKEFSRPEFHRIPFSQIKDMSNLAIGLDLSTLSMNSYLAYTHHQHSIKIGANAQYQNNTRSGFEFFLPDFQNGRLGFITLYEYEKNSNFQWNMGLRWDLGINNTLDYVQYIWNSNEEIIDSLESVGSKRYFDGWSANVGAVWKKNDFLYRFYLAKSLRIPHPVETSANGIHHGTFRHEKGNPSMDLEHGYQLNISVARQYKKFDFEFATYVNYIDQYIYLGPSFPALFSILPEAGQIFEYRQDKAILSGFELEYQYQIGLLFSLNQTIDFVQSRNLNTRLSLPFTPQPSFRTSLFWNKDYQYKPYFPQIYFRHRYFGAATSSNRRDRSERATPSTHLFDLGFNWNMRLLSYSTKLSVGVDNLLDSVYYNHLSRYRWVNIPEQGRNVSISIKVIF